jgi:hypothetical protein
MNAACFLLFLPCTHLAFPSVSELSVILWDASASQKKSEVNPELKETRKWDKLRYHSFWADVKPALAVLFSRSLICQDSPLSSAICSSTCHVIRFERFHPFFLLRSSTARSLTSHPTFLTSVNLQQSRWIISFSLGQNILQALELQINALGRYFKIRRCVVRERI